VTDLTTIDDDLAKKIAGIVRRITSDKPDEATEAVKAFGRTLQSAGADVIHAVAERIEKPSDKLSDAEMKEIFDAGIAKGLQQAKRQARINGTFPSAHDMALYCRERDDRLREKERDFINDMAARSIWRGLTQRQEEWLKSIFLRLGGEMSL
jgi:glucose-6-phosphate dehydrogenase assembly protein OpcA